RQQNGTEDSVSDALNSATSSSDPSVWDGLCEQIGDSGARRVRPVWLPPLSESITLDRVQDPESIAEPGTATAMLGLVDEPANQAQVPLEWDFAGASGNVMIAGGPQTGKSTLLRTLVTRSEERRVG